MDMPKGYIPADVEDKIYKLWEDSKYFNPDHLPGNRKEPYTVILPPPNVTGVLHMGHAAMLAIEDVMIRFNRMRGKKALWVPGTDHAAIATQEKVERDLYKREKKTRHDLGREKFLGLVNNFAKESRDTIVHQLRKMGSSLDWSREAFTLDEKRSLAVRTAFKKMYDAGLIYRGHRIVNWDPKLHTTVSDDEVEWKDQETPFYYFKYGPFTIGTARPETKFGDKYVVMHPDDKRYKEYKHGQEIDLEWINGTITATIIKDGVIDPEFGSGVMTITPWHDATDFDIAERHNLDKEQVIDYDGKLLAIAGEFEGMHIKKARSLIVEKLANKGLVEKVDENYTNRVATNSRGGGMIEPQIKEQWFIDVHKKFELKNSKLKDFPTGSETSLKELMQKAVRGGGIKILPERFEKIYFHWIDNLRDWCISRQIWYGHRIPVWYKGGKTYVETEAPKEDGWEQDPDTLDTWFSSGLWTFSTLGWPEETKDVKTFHPTDVLETGYDIIFFWVARMILMTGFLLEDIPFHTVYLHGLVRDEKGQKMSKSLGNAIDPLDMIEKYGADATRMSLIVGAAPGSDVKLSENKVKGYKHFTNKIWNATRFVLMNVEDYDASKKIDLNDQDQKWLDELDQLKKEVTAHLENYKFYLAADMLYHYFWHTFADKIIEGCKERLWDKESPGRPAAQHVVIKILTDCILMLHPFIPFVTEEIWQKLPKNVKGEDGEDLLMIREW